jgi:hypothetical protein
MENSWVAVSSLAATAVTLSSERADERISQNGINRSGVALAGKGPLYAGFGAARASKRVDRAMCCTKLNRKESLATSDFEFAETILIKKDFSAD